MIRGARSLDTLRGQLNTAAPRRSKASDGGRASAAHTKQNPDSDHEPRMKAGADQVWTAFDFTHDPAGGLDCQRLADALVASGDRRIKYLIWNWEWWRPGIGWRRYTGTNGHTKHLHLSVAASPALFDDTSPWELPGPATTHQEDDMPTPREVAQAVWEYPIGDPTRPDMRAYAWARLGAIDVHTVGTNAAIAALAGLLAKGSSNLTVDQIVSAVGETVRTATAAGVEQGLANGTVAVDVTVGGRPT